MSFNHDEIVKQSEAIVADLRAVGWEFDPVEAAVGIVHYLATRSPTQARALAFCWYGLDLVTLAALVEAGRGEAIAALYQAPTAGRKRYSEAAREFGVRRPDGVAKAVQRGTRRLLLWLLSRRRNNS